MRTKKFSLCASALSLAALPLLVHQAQAIEPVYNLKAAPVTVVMPDPSGVGTVPVTMWGYADCGASFASCPAATVPGPALVVPAGETALTVNLQNDLAQPTSLVINGQFKPMAPVFATDAQGRRRVSSFDAEVEPGGQGTYRWTNVKSGTYLYQSGTQPQVQVQMGLYGAVTKNFAEAGATPAQAYAGVSYGNHATLLYSEIDPAFHKAVANGGYGPLCSNPNWAGTDPASTCVTSTFDYQPKYFLINGKPYTFGTPLIEPAGNPGNTLLRVLNAGLTTHVPMIQGKLWDVIAEDGNAYPYRRTQYTALLPAAKTLDILLAPVLGGGTFPIIDGRLSLSNAGVSEGGMLAFLKFGALTSLPAGTGSGTTGTSGTAGTTGGSGTTTSTNLPPTAANDSYDTVPGAVLNIAALGVLANDADVDSPAIKAVAASGTTTQGGKYTLNADGSFTYEPAAGFSGPTDSFQYLATDGQALSAAATVTINTLAPAIPALTELDQFDRTPASMLLNAAPCDTCWSYVSSTASGPSVQVNAGNAVAGAATAGGRAIYNSTPEYFGTKQGAAVTSAPLANTAVILKATGGTPVAGPANFIRVSCEPTGEAIVATMMGSNSAVYVKQAAFPAPGCAGDGTLTAKADDKGLVSVWLQGGFVGAVQLPDVGAWKGDGRIGIQLQSQDAKIDKFSGAAL